MSEQNAIPTELTINGVTYVQPDAAEQRLTDLLERVNARLETDETDGPDRDFLDSVLGGVGDGIASRVGDLLAAVSLRLERVEANQIASGRAGSSQATAELSQRVLNMQGTVNTLSDQVRNIGTRTERVIDDRMGALDNRLNQTVTTAVGNAKANILEHVKGVETVVTAIRNQPIVLDRGVEAALMALPETLADIQSKLATIQANHEFLLGLVDTATAPQGATVAPASSNGTDDWDAITQDVGDDGVMDDSTDPSPFGTAGAKFRVIPLDRAQGDFDRETSEPTKAKGTRQRMPHLSASQRRQVYQYWIDHEDASYEDVGNACATIKGIGVTLPRYFINSLINEVTQADGLVEQTSRRREHTRLLGVTRANANRLANSAR